MGGENRKIHLAASLLLIFFGLLAYGNSFQVPFVFDDRYKLLDNPEIRSLVAFGTQPSRYIAYLTFALNYYLDGYDVVGYHVVNLAIHLLTAWLVFLLLRLTFGTPHFSSRNTGAGASAPERNFLPSLAQREVFIPLFAALLFVTHPIQTQAVTYVIQRTTSLAALFYLLALVLYVLARLAQERPASSTLKPVLLLAVATLAAVLAMRTKEIAITLPLAVVLYEFCFFRGGWKRRFFSLLPLLATLPIVPYLVLSSYESTGDLVSDIDEQTRERSPLSRSEYLFTQFRVLVTYLRLLLLPIRQNVDYDYPLYRSFFVAPVLASFLLLLALALLGFYLFIRTRPPLPGAGPRAAIDPLGRLVAFGIFWFFLTISVESSFIPIIDVIFEHRLYLPSLGAFSILATGLFLLWRKLPSALGRLVLPLAALWIIALTVTTFQRNYIWGDEVRLWQDVVAKSPQKSRPYNNLGFALNMQGRHAEAMEPLSRAISLAPEHPHAYNNMARALIMSHRSYEAIPLLQKAISLDRWYADAYINLAAAYNQIRQFPQTIDLLERNLHWLRDRAETHYHLGVAYAFLGKRDAAGEKLAVVASFGADDLVQDLRRLLDAK